MSSGTNATAPVSPAPVPSSNPPAASSPAPAAPSNPPAASSPAPAASSPAPVQSSQAPAQNTPAPGTTQVITAPSAAPSTEVQTIIITPSASRAGETPAVIIITSVVTPTTQATHASVTGSQTGSANPSSTDNPGVSNAQKESTHGLTTGGKTAIAVVIPVVVVALLVLGGIFFWRKRKQRRSAEDERRKEMEEYGYNPNHDPTLPAVGGGLAMAEDDSGYRGWGNTTTSSNRKGSTTLNSGMTYSDSNSNPGGYGPNSPTHGTYSDANSENPLVNGRRETMDSDGIGALGVVNGAAANSAQNQAGVHRGPSNASSSYSAAGHSDNSGEYPDMPMNNPQAYYENQGYYQSNPYGTPDPYAAQQQPIIRDVSARRNTRIENPSVFPQQGNSGIAQNF